MSAYDPDANAEMWRHLPQWPVWKVVAVEVVGPHAVRVTTETAPPPYTPTTQRSSITPSLRCEIRRCSPTAHHPLASLFVRRALAQAKLPR